MSFFSNELTEIELIQKYLDEKSRMQSETDYILEDENFIEVKVGSSNGDNTEHGNKLSTERNDNVSDR